MTDAERKLLLTVARELRDFLRSSPSYNAIHAGICAVEAGDAPPAAQPGAVPAELLAVVPSVHYLDTMAAGLPDGAGCTITAGQVREYAKLVRWARSAPPSAPVADWQARAREIAKRLPNERLLKRFDTPPTGGSALNGEPHARHVLADAAALVRSIAAHGDAGGGG